MKENDNEDFFDPVNCSICNIEFDAGEFWHEFIVTDYEQIKYNSLKDLEFGLLCELCFTTLVSRIRQEIDYLKLSIKKD